MTIKEIEVRSGMTRANIRFYEAEGLLNPVRKENGYREYSEEDLNTLRRIHLLRSLRIPLEDIRRLQMGEESLSSTLEKQLAILEQEQASLERSKEVCRAMREDGVSYRNLNAQRYLDQLAAKPGTPLSLPLTDEVPRVRAPWRRFFARWFDFSLCSCALESIAALVFHVNVLNMNTSLGPSLLKNAQVLLMVIVLEPVLLHFFGTTPGKWLLGLRVTDLYGGRLSMDAARRRTLDVLWRGYGAGIPIYKLIRLYRSKKDCDDGVDLPWEYTSELVLKDEKRWRTAAYLLAVGAVTALFAVGILFSQLPPHRGDLTVAQLCENYNRLVEMNEPEAIYRLDSEGSWVEGSHWRGSVYVETYDFPRPELRFTEENGFVTGISFEQHLENESFAPSYATERVFLLLAFAGAQREAGLTMDEARSAAQVIQRRPYDTFRQSVCGVEVIGEFSYEGYNEFLVDAMGALYAGEDGDTSYDIRFSMRK